MVAMQAGKLRHRVAFQEDQGVRNDKGEKVANWQTFATVWGSVEPLSGREFLEAQQQQTEISTRIRIRHLDGVKESMRVLHDGTVYHIEAVIHPEKRGRELVLMCKELT